MFQVNLKTLLVVLAFAGLLCAYYAQSINLSQYEGFVPVVIANQDIAEDTKIEERHLTLQYRQKDLVTDDQFIDVKALIGKTARISVDQGEPILKKAFEKPQFADNSNPVEIPPGHKVVGVKINQTSSLSGLLKPNDTIDITGQHNWLWGTSSTTIRSLKVFSIGKGRGTQSIVGVLVDEPTSQQLVTLTSSASNVKIIVPTAK